MHTRLFYRDKIIILAWNFARNRTTGIEWKEAISLSLSYPEQTPPPWDTQYQAFCANAQARAHYGFNEISNGLL